MSSLWLGDGFQVEPKENLGLSGGQESFGRVSKHISDGSEFFFY